MFAYLLLLDTKEEKDKFSQIYEKYRDPDSNYTTLICSSSSTVCTYDEKTLFKIADNLVFK